MNDMKERQGKVQVSFWVYPETAAFIELQAKRLSLTKTGTLETIIREWDENNDNKLDGLLNQRNDLKKMVNKVNLIKCLSDDLLDDLEKRDRPC